MNTMIRKSTGRVKQSSSRQSWRQKRAMAAICSLVGVLLFSILIFSDPAYATRLPEGMKELIKKTMPEYRVRLDGVLQGKDNSLFVPVIPAKEIKLTTPVQLLSRVPADNPRILIFNNKWVFIKLQNQDEKQVLSLPKGTPEDFKKKLLQGHLPEDLIVPDKMAASEDLKGLIGELDIEVLKEKTASATGTGVAGEGEEHRGTEEGHGDPGEKQGAETVEQKQERRPGTLVLTSPATGKIIALGEGDEKNVELQIDGTPAGMTFCNDKLYVCDQTKNRVLVIDPSSTKIVDQIALKPGTSPKGIASLPKSKYLYVSETAQNYVSVVELTTKKILMRTKVRPGPTKIAITPNGYMLLVLNGQSGEVTFISTLNQKAVGYLKVGELPSDIIISNNSKAAFVSNRASNTISIIDITHRKLANTIKVGEGPTGIALSPDEKMLFVANARDNTIVAYHTGSYERAKDTQLPLDVEFPGKILFIPGTKKLLVTSAATDTIGILDTESMQFSEQPRVGCTTDNVIWIEKPDM